MIKNKDIALIGAGYWGRNFLRILNDFKRLKIVCDIDPKIIKIRKKEYPAVEISKNLKDVLCDKDITAAVIATPADTHYQLAKRFLRAGKDILVEKPFTLKLSQANELLKIAKENKRIMMVDHLFLYHPAYFKIKELIKKNKLGKIYFLNSKRLNLGIIRDKENALWSIAPHDISLISAIVGETPVEVSARGEKCLFNKNIDFASASLKFKRNNISADLYVSWLNPEKERKLTIVGRKAMIVFDDMAKDKLKLCSYKVQSQKNKITKYLKIESKKTKEELIDIAKEEPLKNLVSHFLDCIQKRKTPISSPKEALNVVKILEACEKSIKLKGKTLKI